MRQLCIDVQCRVFDPSSIIPTSGTNLSNVPRHYNHIYLLGNGQFGFRRVKGSRDAIGILRIIR
jgi:hypothetical protein